MMKVFIFGKSTIGDKVLLKLVNESLRLESNYLGEQVDLSKVVPSEENLVIIINPAIFNIDLDKVIGYINKDKVRPLVVLRKLKTFGAVLFKENLIIDRIVTNKICVFAGIIYFRKEDFKVTMAELLRGLDTVNLRTYIIGGKD